MVIADSLFGIPQFLQAANMEAFAGFLVELVGASPLRSLPLPRVTHACASPISAPCASRAEPLSDAPRNPPNSLWLFFSRACSKAR